MVRPAPLATLVAALLVAVPAGATPLRVVGSTTVNPLVSLAAEALRAERGLEIVVDTQGGSSGGIAALGEGRADLAMSSRPLTPEDSRRFPGVRFEPQRVALDGVAVVVAKDVWEGGVRALSREQLRGIYEGRIRNWKDLGGPDRRIVFFNKEPGRGTWEVFAHWLYGDPKTAPIASHPEVGANEEARQKVATTPGAISQLSFAWADAERVFALGLSLDDGTVVPADLTTITNGTYPLKRDLLLISNGPPAGSARELIDYLRGPRGRPIIERLGYLPLPAGKGEGSR
ncbi:MAG TPA: phosphate ABC transporter substrate-binding protein [Thermoanaerobaculia bacterium]|nr:phosphate ABC transporter substrate-binding protein [Thermoanaerobaculia bacterium]